MISNNASVARCEYYKTNSENVLGRFYCKYPDTYFLHKEITNRGIRDIPITKAECEVNNGAQQVGFIAVLKLSVYVKRGKTLFSKR